MFVGDLSAEVNEPMLQQVISQYFPSVISVKVMHTIIAIFLKYSLLPSCMRSRGVQ